MTEILNMQNAGQGQAGQGQVGQAPTTQRTIQDIINDANTITGSMIPGVPGALSDAINNRQRIPGEAYVNGQIWTGGAINRNRTGGLDQGNQNTAPQITQPIAQQTTQPIGQRRTYTDIPPSVMPRGQSTGQPMNNPLGGSPTQRLFNQDQPTAPENKKKKKIQ